MFERQGLHLTLIALLVVAVAAAAIPDSRRTVAGWLGLDSVRVERVPELDLPEGLGAAESQPHTESQYEFLPSAESILQEVVPTSFRVKLFKCFLDAAVSEHIARMVAMKAATENADEIIRQLSMTYNRARQAQITGEIMEIIGGVEALQS
mgnify:CR=1 FL=1